MSNDIDLDESGGTEVIGIDLTTSSITIESTTSTLLSHTSNAEYEIAHKDIQEVVVCAKPPSGKAVISRSKAPDWAIGALEAEGVEIHDCDTCGICVPVGRDDEGYYWEHYDQRH